MYKKHIKRLVDICCALAALVVFWWLYIIIAILVRVKLGSPILFKQKRPGKDEKIFELFKFRTMTDEKDENGKLLPDSVRLTNFGKFLRKTSLDELPEAFNILKGDMSVIGPRPLLVEYLPYYTEREKLRHTVRPGLSGLAQISGRNLIDWEERLKIDVEYVENVTFINDVKIILKTALKMIKREDVAEDTNAAEGNLREIRMKANGEKVEVE